MDNTLEQHQPLKKRMLEQSTSYATQRSYVKPMGPHYIQQTRPQQGYQYVTTSETNKSPNYHQQQQQQNHAQHHLKPTQQFHNSHTQQYQPNPDRNQLLQIQQPIQQVVKYECIEKPMSLNAWTQTKSEDFPNLPSPQHQRNEAMLLAKIKGLEESLKLQCEYIDRLKAENIRTPSPTQSIPNSTTITPTTIKQEGTRYRILAQADECTNEAQIEIELSDEAIPQNLDCSADSDRLEICLSDDNEISPQTPANAKASKDCLYIAERPDLKNATVSIGPNGTKIPVSAYEKMSWSSPSLATRKLLTMIFDRETLATHSMTGKASPAFKDLDKPVKGKLDPNAVQDIIFIVSKKCGVSPKEVRAAITTKCADENKMNKLQALKKFKGSDSPLRLRRAALKELNTIKMESVNDDHVLGR